MNMRTLCLLLATICFTLGAFNVPRVNWINAGLAFATASLLVQ